MKTVRAGKDVVAILQTAYAADKPVILEGPHGVGKSELVEQTAKSLSIGFITRDLSLLEPPDLVGLPTMKKGVTQYATPAFLPRSGKGLLVFEELNRAERYMAAPCLQLLTARCLNDYVLPPGWLPIAAINPPDLGYNVNELDPALLSRFIRLRLEPSAKEWLEWAAGHGIHPAVIRYVRSAGDDIFKSKDSNPRSWKYVSDVVHACQKDPSLPKDNLYVIIAGLVGDVHAVAFVKTLTLKETPIDAETIIKRYDTVRDTVQAWKSRKRTDLLKSTAHGVQVNLQNTDTALEVRRSKKMQGNLTDFIADLPGDLGRKVAANAKSNGALP